MTENTDLIDSIENNMGQVEDYLVEAVDHLEDGEKEYSEAKGKFWCIFFVVLCISTVIVFKMMGWVVPD